MHIVFATIEFVTEKAGDGGLANYLEKASQIFASHGHKVTIVVLSEGNDSFEYKNNIEVIRVLKDDSELSLLFSLIKDMEIRRNLSHCLYSYKINKKIKEINKYNKVDIVQYCHLSALGLFRVKRIPAVVRMSAFDPIDRETHKSDFELKSCIAEINLSDKISFYAIKRADGVFAPGTFTAIALKKVIKKEVTVLETPTMGIDWKQQMRNLPDNLNGKKYFLFFGTLNNKKGLKVIVQSIYKILQANPQYYFVFVGKDCGVSIQEGMRTPVIKKLLEEAKEFRDRVIYFPAVKDRDLLNAIICHAELCILPFRFENLPNVCVEAMELGRIVISTYKSGISQMIKDNHNGFLVEQNNSDALVDKIGKVISLPEEEKRRISENAIKRTQQMAPDRFYEYMMAYYQKIILKKQNHRIYGRNE